MGGLNHPARSLSFSYTLLLSTLAYVTYQDLRTISSFQEQTVIAVKAPPETQLEVPQFSEVRAGLGVGLGAVRQCPGHNVGARVWVLLHLCHLQQVHWSTLKVQPRMALGGFGVSPWGCLTLPCFWGYSSLPGPHMSWGQRGGLGRPSGCSSEPCSPPRTTSSST